MAKLLNEITGQPQVGGALNGWMSRIRIGMIKQNIVDGLPVEVETSFNFVGMIQPLSARKLELKPEGLRAFKWLQIFCQEGMLALKEGDKITYRNERFKLMADSDYRNNGYVEYHVIRDFENAQPDR